MGERFHVTPHPGRWAVAALVCAPFAWWAVSGTLALVSLICAAYFVGRWSQAFVDRWEADRA